MAMVAGLIGLALGCLAGWFCRYFVIEPEQIHALCNATVPPAWCRARAALIAVTFPAWYGTAAIAAGVLAWSLRGRPAAVCAVCGLFAGGLGLFLYDTGWAATGVLVALLRLSRVGEEPPDSREFTA